MYNFKIFSTLYIFFRFLCRLLRNIINQKLKPFQLLTRVYSANLFSECNTSVNQNVTFCSVFFPSVYSVHLFVNLYHRKFVITYFHGSTARTFLNNFFIFTGQLFRREIPKVTNN